jgi:phosphatidylserine decarboxylase
MFHKEGYKIIFIGIVSFIVALLLADKFVNLTWLRIAIQLIVIFLFVMILQFFRNPNRKIVPNDNYFLAPVDGKVVVIEEVYEEEYFKDKRIQVSIFMSPINVHVTRYGASGKIKFSKYHPGKYLVAWHPKASTENERTTIVIETKEFGEVLYRQIAGALARRIINYAEVGQQVVQGDDAGFIKFGSRVDIYFPIGTKVDVALNQNAVGNQTVIASK